METKKLEQSELDNIKELQNNFNKVTFEIGSIEANIHLALTQIKELEAEKNKKFEELNKINEDEKALVNLLQTKYGSGNIDIVEGTITPL